MTLGFRVVAPAGGFTMRIVTITAVLCALVLVVAGDAANLRAKARLFNKFSKHKRGALSHLPTFKLGHDIPVVSHSVLKPFVVTYPPTATVTAFKVPLTHPQRVPVVHKHGHFGLKFPHHHHQTKTVVLSNPDQHFHHHHHHLEPRPIVPVAPTVSVPAPAPVPAAPVIPVASPTIVRPVPVPSPPVVLPPVPLFPAPVARPPPIPVFPPHPTHVTPLLPAAQIPLRPIVPVAPAFPVPQQYIIRPGNSIQTSFFATYPRYPLVNYQHLYPAPPPPPVPTVGPVFFNRPPQVPHFHLGGQPSPTVGLEPTPTFLHPTQTTFLHPTQATLPQSEVHLHPTQQVPLDHDGWAPVQPHAQPHDVPTHTEAHIPQPHEGQFTQEQGTQVYEHHTGDQQYHDYQNQLHHIQQQIDQAQYEQHLHNQHQLGQEYGAPQLNQDFGQPQQGQDFGHGQFVQQQHQDFGPQDFNYHAHDFNQQGQEFGQHGQDFSQHGQDLGHQAQDFGHQGQGYDYHGQDFGQGLQQQLGQEYGAPQQVEGRSGEAEGEDTQKYHNHIPLGLQPPIDRPLEHFS